MLDLAAELGDLEAAKAKLRELRQERERLAADLARTERALPTIAELEPLVRAKLRDLKATLRADVGLGHLTLGGLLGEDRLRVYADGRIEGTATLRPGTLSAPRRTSGPIDSVVAGAGFEPATCGL